MIATCVASASPSARLCVTRSSAAPAARRSESAVVSAALPTSSSPVYGSSQRMSRGPWTMARAIETRCCNPRLSARTGASARSSTRIDSRAARAARTGSETPYMRAVNSRFSRAVSAPYSMLACEMNPTWPRAPCADRITTPPTVACPLEGASSPARRRSSVVLPAPFGPKSARQSPGASAKLTSFTARRPPNARTSPSAWATDGGAFMACRLACRFARDRSASERGGRHALRRRPLRQRYPPLGAAEREEPSHALRVGCAVQYLGTREGRRIAPSERDEHHISVVTHAS